MDGKLQASEIQDEFHRLFGPDFSVRGVRGSFLVLGLFDASKSEAPVVPYRAKRGNTGVPGGWWTPAMRGLAAEPPRLNLESNGLVVRGR
jgi:hypothetical protein